MDAAYRRGKALATLFDAAHHDGTTSIAVIVDLPGPEAVAFAAGACTALDPVFLFDNWPHPRGVVPAHLTLAAARITSRSSQRAKTRPRARRRCSSSIARASPRTPTTRRSSTTATSRACRARPVLAKLGVTHVLYVAPTDADRELDDLNDDFVYTVKQGAQLKALGVTAFASGIAPTPPTTTTADAGVADTGPDVLLRRRSDDARVVLDRLPVVDAVRAEGPETARRAVVLAQRSFVRSDRAPEPVLDRRASGSLTPPRPIAFGTVPVVIAATTGVILGAKMSRSGSWTRSPRGEAADMEHSIFAMELCFRFDPALARDACASS